MVVHHSEITGNPEAELCADKFPPPEIIPVSIGQGVEEIVRAYPKRFATGRKVRFFLSPDRKGLSIRVVSETVEIRFSQPRHAFRALGILMGREECGHPIEDYEEESGFESLGVMLDVSRNAVLRLDSIQRMIRSFALMGINQLMLYTEDTYEIPGEPLFGYFRGRYSQEELSSIDAYAAQFRIEVIPCIQTLGHLEQVLHWPVYRPLQDTAGVLLAGDPGSEALVEKMISAASAPFRSRRIHIGMDEAHGIGSGQYRFRNGYQPPFEILITHLERVAAMCREKGLKPMIWSDMFFRLGSKTNQYYDRASSIPPEAAKRIADDVELVYWDYYHTDSAFYDDWIARHRAMGKEPIFAAGIWTWNRNWTALPHSFATIRAGMDSARRNGLTEAFVTAWGDDGTECDIFSALPAVQLFAEMAYAPERADEALNVHFKGSCGADGAAWFRASKIDLLPGVKDPSEANTNSGKWILWHDPILNFLDQHIPADAPAHYAKVAAECCEGANGQPEDGRLRLVGKLAHVLSQKSALHLALRPAYQRKDHKTLEQWAHDRLPTLQCEVTDLWKAHREAWHVMYKPFGWEIIEGRYGALSARLETLREKLLLWLENPSHPIEELDCESIHVFPPESQSTVILYHHQTRSPSRIY